MDGVKFCVPEKVVCSGVPCGDGLALMREESSVLAAVVDCWEVGSPLLVVIPPLSSTTPSPDRLSINDSPVVISVVVSLRFCLLSSA